MSNKSVSSKEEIKTLKKLGKKALEKANTLNKWTEKEDSLLKKYFDDGLSIEQAAIKLNRTKQSVASRRQKLKLSIRRNITWTPKEIKMLKEKSNSMNGTEMQKVYFQGKKLGDIYKKRKELGLKHKFSPKKLEWSKKELNLLKNNASFKTNLELSKIIKTKSINEIYRMRHKLGIKAPNSKKEYSNDKLKIIKDNLHLQDKEIANLINENVSFVIRARLSKLGIKKKEIPKNFPKYFIKWYKPELNNDLNLNDFVFDTSSQNSKKRIILVCPKSKHHILSNSVKNFVNQYKRKKKIVCRYCTFQTTSFEESLAKNFPILSKNLVKSKNIKPENISIKSYKSYKFKCNKGHIEGHAIKKITLDDNSDIKNDYTYECNTCKTGLLKELRPDIFREIDILKNKNIDFDNLLTSSNKTLWWICSKDALHSWQTSIITRTSKAKLNCPYCLKQWNKSYLKLFLKSVIPLLPSMSQSERWVFFQGSGILDSSKRNIAFAKQVISQKFPVKEIEKFVNDKVSLVDDILDDITVTSEDYLDKETYNEIEKEVEQTVQEFDDVIEQEEERLPEIKSKDVLKSLDQITSSQFCDKEAIEFLIISKKEKLWRDVFERGKAAVNEIKKATGNEYVKRVKDEFLFEYDHTIKLKSPKNFNARTKDGNLIKPNLMQFLTATRLDFKSRIGNWSGTGAGKTLSAILASRLLDMKFTIVTCPNSVVVNWQNNIKDAFQDSEILDKSELPDKINPQKYSYLVLNYEYFQQPSSSSYVKKLLSLGKISFIVIDEVHYTKQREIDNVSKRKEMIKNLVVEAGKKNKNLKVIGMSATPVINNLYEGRSMIELITGKEHKDIDTTVNVNNCMYLFQKLSTIGTRYLPQYQVGIKEEPHYVDCSDVVEEIREKGANQISVLALELILTRKRIPEIIKHLEKKTVIYTHYIKGIGELLAEAISKEGYTVGFYTGEDKSGFDSFIKGNTDVLIGTSAIGTGVDGLQHVCRKLIFNVLPWTNAEYEQIKGRIFRQGQKQNVEFILPLTKAEVNGQEWSWCKTKLDRIHYKKTVADASVDGIIPEEHIRSEHQVLQDLMKWLDRLSDKGLETIERKELASTLFTDDEKELRRRKIKHGDFTKINTRWNNSRSGITHKRLQKDNHEWAHYHEEYRKARKDWVMTPYKEMVKFYKKRDGLVIGDFGCGEGFIYKELSSKHKVHSFDHVAAEEFVTECDFSKTPLDDETLDVAIYSLSMMGSNINEYLHEAHRVLKLDGKINIIEATSRFKDVKQFMNQLQDFGFDRVVSSDMWKFTHIVAEKSDRVIKKDAKIKF